MIELAEAIALVEETAAALPPRRQRLLEACGRRLVEPLIADADSPPWDRAMMDALPSATPTSPAPRPRSWSSRWSATSPPAT